MHTKRRLIIPVVTFYLLRQLFGSHWFRDDADELELLLIGDLIFALGDGFVVLVLAHFEFLCRISNAVFSSPQFSPSPSRHV